MLKRLLILPLAGLLTFCAALGIGLGALATNRLTPPGGILQLGAVRVQAISPCRLDEVVHTPCLLPDSGARWLLRLEILDLPGRQRWTLYGGGPGPLRVERR